jgi:hypothetical protein
MKRGHLGPTAATEMGTADQVVVKVSPAASLAGGDFDATFVARILPALSFWLTMSMTVILFNKFMFSEFPFPASLTCVHMLFSTLATAALRASGRLAVPTMGWCGWARAVLPIGLMYSLALVTSNMAANILTVSFVQMLKACTPMVVLSVAALQGTERATRNIVVVVFLMTAGVGIASWGELHFDLVGMLLQVFAFTIEAFRLQAVQFLMQKTLPKGSSPFVALGLFAPVCFVFLLPWSLYKEPRAVALALSSQRVQGLLFLNALSALGLNAGVVWLVSFDSGPLTLTLVGVLKDVALIVSSVWLFGNRLTYVQLGGVRFCFVCLCTLSTHHPLTPPHPTLTHTHTQK